MSIIQEKDGVWLQLEETIAQHHEEVFGCFTTAGGLMRWFSIDAELDLRTGGTIEFYWDHQKTHKTTIAILDYNPDGSMVWDWFAGPVDTHAPVYWVVKPDVEKGSIVTLRQGPFMNDEENLLLLADEAASWSWHLCNLRGVLEAKHDMRKVKPL
ncbi:MAG: SRPBCC domain-containing protein [Planctomycetota bacterium]|nr:SRPBCC domain-containing protein [Planctomycetota bacterium]